MSHLGVSIAIALAALPFAAGLASAAPPLFLERSGTASPFDGLLDEARAALDFADLDADGDLDMLAGNLDGFVRWYENQGSAQSPDFQQIASHPMSGIPLAYLPWFELGLAPSLGDLDGDGDLDALFGGRGGVFDYFENTGSAGAGTFARRTGSQNPLDGHLAGGDWSTIELADLDADGDLDALAGSSSISLRYFENQGSPTVPSFVPQTGAADPFDGLLMSGSGGDNSRATPSLGDVDGDGDLDLVVGSQFGGTFDYYENVGSAQAPALIERTGTDNPFGAFSVTEHSAPALADIDGDGDLDMVSGSTEFLPNDFFYYEQVAPAGLPLGPAVALGTAITLLLSGRRSWRRARQRSARPLRLTSQRARGRPLIALTRDLSAVVAVRTRRA